MMNEDYDARQRVIVEIEEKEEEYHPTAAMSATIDFWRTKQGWWYLLCSVINYT